jgi:hypothetical protein
MTEGVGSMTQSDKPSEYLVCTARACLDAHESQVIDIEGVYVFPHEQAFAVHRLLLYDGTTIILAPPQGSLRDLFVEANDGASLLVRGRIFCKQIPPRYRIIGRTPEPYLLDLERACRLDCRSAEG